MNNLSPWQQAQQALRYRKAWDFKRTLDHLKLDAYRRAFDEDFAYLPAMTHRARAVCFREDYPDACSGLHVAVYAALEHPTN
ncbi:MAG: hypothetical protein ACE10K_14860 [Rhodothermales bacterium]